jgi:hypothetical protein
MKRDNRHPLYSLIFPIFPLFNIIYIMRSWLIAAKFKSPVLVLAMSHLLRSYVLDKSWACTFSRARTIAQSLQLF